MRPFDLLSTEFLIFGILKKRITDRQNDGRTDGRTDPLIEMRGRIFRFTTDNNNALPCVFRLCLADVPV